MDPLITIGTAIGTSLLTNFATKGDSEPIKTLNDIWYLAFGRMQLFADKKRTENKVHLEEYQKELVHEISSIPDDNLIEPPLSVVGPALEASVYYIEEEILRKMFARVISSSMDNRKNSRTHHSFVEIIKQLSPLDAKNLEIIMSEDTLPIVNYGIELGISSYEVFHRYIFLHNENEDVNSVASSLINLQRLGLISIDFSKTLFNLQEYNRFENHPLYFELENQMKSEEFLNNNLNIIQEYKIKMEEIHPKIEKGYVELTPLGKDFIYVCL